MELTWLNEPPRWRQDGEQLVVRAGAKTDFWRTTHYGFIRDTGHAFLTPLTGDFTAEVEVRGAYATLYDQAGLMLRIDEHSWIKCGIEYVGDVQQASAVVTRDYSDWSVAPLDNNPPAIWLRVVRKGDGVEIFYSLDGHDFRLLRLAYLPPAATLHVGPMCAAPDGEGFDVTFVGFRVRHHVRGAHTDA